MSARAPPRDPRRSTHPILAAAIAVTIPPGSVVLLFQSGNLETET